MIFWRHSKIRFYLLNCAWNYKFWLFAEKVFKIHTYYIENKELSLDNVDITGKIIPSSKKVSKRRFVGYMYDGMMHLDNPGFRHKVDNDTWNAWRNKGIIK